MMNSKTIIFLLLFFFVAALLSAQESENSSDFSNLMKEKAKHDSIILSRLSPELTSSTNIDMQKRISYNESFSSDEPLQRNLPLLILLIIAFILVIILMIIQLNLRQKMKKIQMLEDMKSQHKTRTLLKSIEAQKQDLNRLRQIESSYRTMQASHEQLKDQVKKSELLQRAIIALKYPVVLTDLKGQITFCNLEFAQLHGYHASELLGKNISKLFPDALTIICTYENREKWEDQVLTVTSQRKDGTRLNLYEKSALLFDADHHPTYILSSFDQIPLIKEDKSEEYEKICEQRSRMFENIMDVYYEVDINGKIRELSPSILRLGGYQRNELLGKDMKILYADQDQHLRFAAALRKDRDLTDFDIKLKKKDGEIIDCTITARLLVDEDRMPFMIVGCLRDFCSNKQDEEKPNKAMEELKMVNKDLLDFAYITSHDLKSPLRAINTLANWVVMDETNILSEESKSQMQLLVNRTERMHNLIDAIFDYTNIVSFEGEKSFVDLNKILSSLQKRMSIPSHISIKVKENMPSIYFERSRIEQIFENLIENSIKFMDKDKGVIVVEWMERQKEYEFSVSDNGPGIEPKYFEKVFEIFQTLKPRDEVEGVGIGLAIVRKIITKYGGKIWLKSTPETGLTVSFTIPKTEKE